MFFILILSLLLSLAQTNPSNRGYINERLHLAALDVISMHSQSVINEVPRPTTLDKDNCVQSEECGGKAQISDPEIMRGHKIYEIMNNLKERFAFQQTYLQKISDGLKYAIRPNSNHLILNQQMIRNLTALSGITARMKTLGQTFWQNSKLTLNDMKFKVKDLNALINLIERQIANILHTTNDIVLKNRFSVISGHKTFFGQNQISSLNSTSVVVNSIGRQNVRQVMSNLYRKRRPQIVRGIKQIVRPTLIRNSLNSNLINGIEFNKQMITTNGPQIIKSSVHFYSQLSVVNRLIIGGKLNNIDINRDLVFLNRPEEAIPVPKIFTSPVIIAQNVNSQTIDGIDLRQLANNVLMSNGIQNIKQNLLFRKELTTKSIKVDGVVNNIDISLMATQLVYKNRPLTVRGKKFFILDDFHIKNNIFIGDRIDGYKVPNDLMHKNLNQTITATKVFNGITRFENRVIVNGFVDGLRLPQDIVSLTTNETIFGQIVFGRGLVANQDIDARRLVDGVDLSQLKHYSLKSGDKFIESNVRFERPVTVGFVEVKGLINGIKLDVILNEAIFRGTPIVKISGTKSFESIKVKALSVETINGFNLNDFVSTHRNDIIFAPKVFTFPIQFNSMNISGLVARVNLTSLYTNRISLTKPEVIFGIKNFANDISVENVIALTKINGLVPQIDFVIKSKPQTIKGLKIFIKPLIANNVKVRTHTLVKGKINGIPLRELSARAIRLNSHLTTPLNITLMNSNSTFVESFKGVNSLDIKNFADNVMSVSRPQTVFSPKFFGNIQTFFEVKSLKGISRISLSYLKQNAVLLNGFNHIKAPLTFTHSLTFERPLIVKGVVNGVNLTYLANDAVYKSGNKLITGQNIFKSGFRVNGNIHLHTFNGIDLSNQLLTKTRNHIIKGRVKFVKTLNINGNILLNGLINGLKLSDFNSRVIKTNNRNVINGNLELIGGTKVLTNLQIWGRLNGHNLTQLFNNAVFLNSNEHIIGSKRIMASIHLLRNLNATNLNDKNIYNLLENIVYIDSPIEQKIFAPKVFTNNIRSNGLIQSKGIAIMGPINGINIIELDLKSIKTNRRMDLKLIRNFKDLTQISNNFTLIYGRINGVDLERDVIHANINNGVIQLITGNKVFQHLVLNDNLLINGLVNGFPLKAIELNTFFTTNDQRITNNKIIRSLLELSANNNFVGRLNGMRVPQDLVTLRDNQTVFGSLIFNKPLHVNRNILVTGPVSGHNLTELVTQSLTKDIPQLISHPIKFDTIVFRSDVKVDKSVDNVDLSTLSKNVEEFTSLVNGSKELLELKASRHHLISSYLQQIMEMSPFQIDSFNFYQTLDEIHGNHIQIISDGVLTLTEMSESPKSVHLIKYNSKKSVFEGSLVNENPLIIKKSFVLNGESFSVNFSPFSHSFSSDITKSGQLIEKLPSYISFVEVIKISETNILLISFQSNEGKVSVHSFVIHANKKHSFTKITEYFVGIDTSKVIAFLKENEVYIVVAKQLGLNCKANNTGSLVFVLRNRKLDLIQKLEVINVMDVIHFENNQKHYLALSDGTPVETSMSPQTIYIYRSDSMRKECSFSLFQKLLFDNVIQLSAFNYGTAHSQHQYLVALNSSKLSIWKQKGESGFVDNWLLKTNSGRIFAPIIADKNLFLIVGQKYKCHQSLVFRAETNRMSISPIIFKTIYNN